MKQSTLNNLAASLCLTALAAACGGPTTASPAAARAEADAGLTQNAQAQNTASPSDGNDAAYHGVYFKGSKHVYVSKGPLACDSNVLQPNQDMLRLVFTALDGNTTYRETENFYFTKQNPAVVPEPVGFDGQCGNKNYVDVSYAANANQVPFPLSGQVAIDTVDAQSAQLQGRLINADQSPAGTFSATACPDGAPEPQSGAPVDHCVFAEACTPLTVSCEAPTATP